MALNINRAIFVKSAAGASGFITDGRPCIVFAGKSNVGKSSVINRLLNRKNFARVGSQPGKTVHVNYFDIDGQCYFVDLPGYGYAAVSKGEKNLWAKVIEEYLNVRPQLYLVLLLLDIRHKPSKDDENMYRWILASGLAYLIVATKSDKISRQQLQHNTALIRSTLQIPPNKDIICVSAEKRTGIEALWDAIDGYITEEEEATK